jgi:hypothetical protein
MTHHAIGAQSVPARLIRDRDAIFGAAFDARVATSVSGRYEDRPHMSIGRDAPVARAVQPPSRGRVVSLPRVGGSTTATQGAA